MLKAHARSALARTACILILLAALCTSGCAQSAGDAHPAASTDGRIKIVCTTFAAYDWVRTLAGSAADNYEIDYLLGSGVDMHSFQPTVQDVAAIAASDLFVYVGGESEEWVADALAGSVNQNQKSLCLIDAIGELAATEEVVEGMQANDDDGAAEADDAPDEHVWLSLRNAQAIVGALASTMEALDPQNADSIEANAKDYLSRLDALDALYQQTVDAASGTALVVADRFPLRYLVRDYAIDYYAAFPGCSAETEASFETVAFLAHKVDELGLGAIVVIDDSDALIAQTVIDTTAARNQDIVRMDSLQAVSDDDIAAGASYLSAMESNRAALAQALK